VCSLCKLIRCPEHLIGRHWCLPADGRSFIWWSPEQWVSPCYSIECDRSFYCGLFCVFITHVIQCSISLCSELHHLRSLHWTEMSGQLHALTALLPWGKVTQYPLCRRLGGHQSWYGCHGEDKNLACARNWTVAFQPVAHHCANWVILTPPSVCISPVSSSMSGKYDIVHSHYDFPNSVSIQMEYSFIWGLKYMF
jgi:hypothetical protein